MRTVEIGSVARAHGIRGELRIRLHWPDSTVLADVGEVWLADGKQPPERFVVGGARRANKAMLLSLEGVDDRDGAERLRGRTVLVSRDAMPPLEAGEYYLCDLVGAEVVGPSGPVGEVVEVRVHPSVDAMVVKRLDGTLAEQPIAEPWIGDVDVEARRVTLTTTDGLV